MNNLDEQVRFIGQMSKAASEAGISIESALKFLFALSMEQKQTTSKPQSEAVN